MQTTSRSCRGEWKLARNTHNASIPTPATQQYHHRTIRGRASTRPYTACICQHITACTMPHTNYRLYMPQHNHRMQIHPLQTPSRSCRGEWKLARNTRNASISPPATQQYHRRDDTRASFHSPLHCIYMYMPTHHTTACTMPHTNCPLYMPQHPHRMQTNRVAVGASGSSPETHTMHPFPPAGDTTIPPRDDTRASFHSPLHCIYMYMPTHHIIACTCRMQITACTMPQHNHRMQTHRMQTPPRSCRDEWKLARNTRNASISPRRRHNNTTTGTIRGRASTRPYTAYICQHITACICRHPHRAQTHRMQIPPRSCRGEWKLARNTRNAPISPRRRHNNTTTGTIRGRASTRPYTAYTCHVQCQHITPCTCRNTPTARKSTACKSTARAGRRDFSTNVNWLIRLDVIKIHCRCHREARLKV